MFIKTLVFVILTCLMAFAEFAVGQENTSVPPPVVGGHPNQAPPEVVMARVGDQKITVQQFMEYISKDSRLVPQATTASGKAQIVREMIIDRLLLEGMRREGLLPSQPGQSPTQQDYLHAYSILAQRHFPEANAAPEEKEIYQYYLDHQEEFGIPAMVRISQIQFRVPREADASKRATVKERATAALERLQKGESFAALAKELTENPKGKVAGGDLGFLPLNQDPWLQQAVSGLKVAQFSQVLESPVGYEIIQVTDKRDALTAPYANVRDAIINRIRLEKHRKAREAYAWELAKQVGVSVEMEDLKDALPPQLGNKGQSG